MKKTTIYIVFLAFLVLTGCSGDSVEDAEQMDYGSIQARIDGTMRTLPGFYAAFYSEFDDLIVIYAYNGDLEIGISIRIPPEIGTYNFDEGNVYATLTFGDPFDFFDQNNDGPAIDHPAVAGYGTITELNEENVVGVFEFNTELQNGGTHIVKEGEFNILRQ